MLAVDSCCSTRAVAAVIQECSLESNVHLLVSQMPRLLPDRSMQQRTKESSSSAYALSGKRRFRLRRRMNGNRP